jgi:large conductance mechanosensitive channel
MQKHMLGFVDFIREQGVIGLAVGLAIGVAAGDSVNSVVDGFISPIVGYILGGADLSTLQWETGLVRGTEELIIKWGLVADSLIKLFAVAGVVYMIIHLLKLDRLDKKKD